MAAGAARRLARPPPRWNASRPPRTDIPPMEWGIGAAGGPLTRMSTFVRRRARLERATETTVHRRKTNGRFDQTCAYPRSPALHPSVRSYRVRSGGLRRRSRRKKYNVLEEKKRRRDVPAPHLPAGRRQLADAVYSYTCRYLHSYGRKANK